MSVLLLRWPATREANTLEHYRFLSHANAHTCIELSPFRSCWSWGSSPGEATRLSSRGLRSSQAPSFHLWLTGHEDRSQGLTSGCCWILSRLLHNQIRRPLFLVIIVSTDRDPASTYPINKRISAKMQKNRDIKVPKVLKSFGAVEVNSTRSMRYCRVTEESNRWGSVKVYENCNGSSESGRLWLMCELLSA